MSRMFYGCVLTSALTATLTVAAQTPQTQTSSTPVAAPAAQAPAAQTPAQAPAAQAQAGVVTVEGCLVREVDVPGFKPNPAERVGIAEDYILTSTKMVTGSAPAIATAQNPAGDTPVGTSGTQGAMMFDVEGISDGQLKQLVGRRVQIDGTFEKVADAKLDKPTTANHLVDIRGTVIRQVAPDCNAK